MSALGVVILAAGASTRMGRPKLLLPWGRTSVLGHIVEQWRTLGAAQIAVVHAAGDQELRAELRRLGIEETDSIQNEHPERGMFSSIRAAARWPGWKGSLRHHALVLGDQPQIGADILRQLLDFARLHPQRVCQPRNESRGRHPVILPRPIFAQLAECRPETLRDFLATLDPPVAGIALDDPALDVDLDSPADYAEAVRRFVT